MLPSSQREERSLGALLQELVEGSSRLLRQEWRLATLQLRELGLQLGRGTAEVAIAGVCFALGGAAILTGAVLALAEPWVRLHVAIAIASGIVLLLALVLWLVKRGTGSLMKADFADDNDTEVLQWQHQRRKFAATSR